MVKPLFYSIAITVASFISSIAFAQGNKPVKWHFNAEQTSPSEISINISADVAPGWHLYSQFLSEGGPQPTKFYFQHSNDYLPIGSTEEKGSQVKYHDDIYEMEIIWYQGIVSFIQKAKFNTPVFTIKGRVEYMTCNDHLCVPDQQEFSINFNAAKRNP